MDDRQSHFRLGLFVLITVGAMVGILFVLGGRSLFESTVVFETYFNESVVGLDLGAPLRFRGVPIGQVSEIFPSPLVYEREVPIDGRKAYIVVRAKITAPRAQAEQWRREVGELVKRGLRAQTHLAGVTGQQYLALDYQDPKKYPGLAFAWTPEYIYVPSVPSISSEIATSAQRFLARLDEPDVRTLIPNLNALIVTVDRKFAELPVGALSSEAGALLKDGRVAAGNIAAASARLDQVLADPRLGQTVANAAALSERLRKIADSGEVDRIVGNLDVTIQRLDAMLGDNQYDLRVIVQDLRTTADNLRSVSESAKRYPAGVLLGGPPDKVVVPKASQ